MAHILPISWPTAPLGVWPERQHIQSSSCFRFFTYHSFLDPSCTRHFTLWMKWLMIRTWNEDKAYRGNVHEDILNGRSSSSEIRCCVIEWANLVWKALWFLKMLQTAFVMTQHLIPEDLNVQQHCCEISKSGKFVLNTEWWTFRSGISGHNTNTNFTLY